MKAETKVGVRATVRTGMTQNYRTWRAMARQDGARLKAAGFRDNPTKDEREELRLDLKVVPGWAPGRSMKWPKPTVMNTVGSATSGKAG